MKKSGLFLIIFGFIPYFVLCAEIIEKIPLTLDEAVAIALRDNREILLKAEEVKKAKFKISEAKAELFPTLDFSSSLTYARRYYPKDIRQTTTQTTLKQYLYKGGKTINTIKQNEYEFEVSQALLDKTKLEIVWDVKRAFYTLLLAQGFTRLNKEILENATQYLNYVKVRYKNGQASESDILKIESSLGSIRQAYEASLNQAESSLALLKNLLYLDEEVEITPVGEFTYEPKEIAFDEAFLKAMQARPEIKQYEAQSQADKKAIEVAKSDSRPSVYASWDYYSRSTTSLTFSPSRGWQDYNIVGVTFVWPIFDGWMTKAKIEQAIVDLSQTQILKEKTVRDIALELKNAWLSLKNAIAKIEAAESEVKLYADNLQAVKQKYNRGITSPLDLNDTILKYDVSLFNKNEAIYDYVVAKSSFDKAMGAL